MLVEEEDCSLLIYCHHCHHHHQFCSFYVGSEHLCHIWEFLILGSLYPSTRRARGWSESFGHHKMGSLQKILLQYLRAEGTYGRKQSFEQPFGCLIGVELCAEKLQCDNLEFSFCVLLYSYVDKVGLLG